jgi:hypothetical protein
VKTPSEKNALATEIDALAAQALESLGGEAHDPVLLAAGTGQPALPALPQAEDAPLIANPYGYKYTDKLGRPPSSFNLRVPACMAHNRDGTDCTKACMVNAAGEYTRCRNHGGRSTGPPKKSGQYSKVAARRIMEVAEDMENDAGLTAIENNVKLVASLFIEKVSALEEEGLTELTDSEMGKLLGMAERLSTLIERRHRIREGQKYTVKIEHLQYIVVAVSDAVNRVLIDQPELRERLAHEIEGIRVIEG